MKKLSLNLLVLLSAPLSLCALDVTVEAFRDGKIPTGYVDTSGVIPPENMIKVSEAPYVDYLIPNNSGATGIMAQKQGGLYMVESTVGDLTGGANSSTAPDIYSPVFDWSDGIPLPFGTGYWGVSWGGWAANETVSMLTRINLASTEPLRIFHWFNDGWNYNNHNTLDGHNLGITHYDAQGNTVDSFTAVLPSGGAEAIFGDHRQFYTAIIDLQATGDGDFLLIQQEAGNIGYRGTAVAIREGGGDPDPVLQYTPGAWSDDPILGQLYGFGDKWIYSPSLGVIYDAYPWLFLPQTGWVADLGLGMSFVDGIFLFSADHGMIWTSAATTGQYYRFDESRWVPFQ